LSRQRIQEDQAFARVSPGAPPDFRFLSNAGEKTAQNHLHPGDQWPMARDRCYDFENIFAEKWANKLSFFTQTTTSFWKKNYHNIGL
jgi:hypothetical protein